MQQNENEVADPSQVSVSGQDDSLSVFLQSSKIRNKLEKLAQWRINASLIEFPPDAREFSGGFAKVSRGLLASRSRADGGTNKPEHIADEHLVSNLDDPQSVKDPREPEGNDHTKGEGRHGSAEEQKLSDSISLLKIRDGSGIPKHIVDEEPDFDNRNPQPQSDTRVPRKNQQDQGERTDRQTTDEDEVSGEKKEEARKESDDSNEEHRLDHQPSKSKIVAVKKLKIENDTDLERVLGLALKETEFLSGLSHPNIVNLEGFVEDLSGHKVWLIFPWEEHGNLRDFLALGEWAIPERISLINDVTLGLEYLHMQKPPIYHGDLKSLNILVNSKCRALITDFGSARHLRDDHVSKQPKGHEDKPRPTIDPTASEEQITLEAFFSATASTLTLSGSSYSLRWAAPELLQDDKPCLGSDIWALGWIAYEVMTNTIPFHDIKKDAIVINRVIQGHLPSVTEHARMSLIRGLCSLMVQCWNINPDKRPTVEECRKFISWMPMIVPAPTQSVDDEASQLRHAQLLNELGHMYIQQADYISAFGSFSKALDIYTNRSENIGRGRTLRYLADVHRLRSEYTEAVRFYSEARQVLIDVGDESGKVTAVFGLAEAHRLQNDYSEAVKLYSECLQIYTSIGSKRERATSLWGLATVHKLRNEYSEAIDLYSEALQVYTDVGDRRERALTLWGLGEVHRFQHQFSEAINLYTEAAQIFTDVGDLKERALTLWSLADGYRVQDRYSEASKFYSESRQIYTDIGDRQGRGMALWGFAEVHRALHEYNEATELYSEAIQIFTDLGDKYWRAETLLSFADTNHVSGHPTKAISFYKEASEVLEEMGDSKRASDALEKAAAIRKTLQDATAADSAEAATVGEGPLFTSG